jgi:hypothetical protein
VASYPLTTPPTRPPLIQEKKVNIHRFSASLRPWPLTTGDHPLRLPLSGLLRSQWPSLELIVYLFVGAGDLVEGIEQAAQQIEVAGARGAGHGGHRELGCSSDGHGKLAAAVREKNSGWGQGAVDPRTLRLQEHGARTREIKQLQQHTDVARPGINLFHSISTPSSTLALEVARGGENLMESSGGAASRSCPFPR